jgi:hypothetical protein
MRPINKESRLTALQSFTLNEIVNGVFAGVCYTRKIREYGKTQYKFKLYAITVSEETDYQVEVLTQVLKRLGFVANITHRYNQEKWFGLRNHISIVITQVKHD